MYPLISHHISIKSSSSHKETQHHNIHVFTSHISLPHVTHLSVENKLSGTFNFSAVRPHVWNYLLTDLRHPDVSYSHLSQAWKTFLSGRWEQSTVWFPHFNCALEILELAYLQTCLFGVGLSKAKWFMLHPATTETPKRLNAASFWWFSAQTTHRNDSWDWTMQPFGPNWQLGGHPYRLLGLLQGTDQHGNYIKIVSRNAV